MTATDGTTGAMGIRRANPREALSTTGDGR